MMKKKNGKVSKGGEKMKCQRILEADDLFREANKKLSFKQFYYWLCYYYGITFKYLKKKDIKILRKRIKEKEVSDV